MPLGCSSRLETPKILFIIPEFVSKNRYFRRFCGEDLFFGLHLRIHGQESFFRRFCGEDIFFFDLVFTPEFEEFRLCFVVKMFVFLVFTLEFRGNKVFVPHKKIVYSRKKLLISHKNFFNPYYTKFVSIYKL